MRWSIRCCQTQRFGLLGSMNKTWIEWVRWGVINGFAISLLGVGSLVSADEQGSDDAIRIAFGSCNHQDLPQPLWNDILQQKPQFWVWLGDNIYGDTEDMAVMREKYDRNKAHPGYTELRQRAEVLGTWDDHDYGVNDGGRDYAMKEASKLEFARFLDLAETHEIFSREGIYHHVDRVVGDGFRLRFILLDTRTFRGPLERAQREGEPFAVYQPDPEGGLLGEAQWEWLQPLLNGDDFDFCILASSIQLLSAEHAFEKWANFPRERQRLIDWIDANCPGKALVISGDRHHSELSRLELSDRAQLIDATSSALNRPGGLNDEPNALRVDTFSGAINYGLVTLRPSEGVGSVKILLEGNVGISELQFPLGESNP